MFIVLVVLSFLGLVILPVVFLLDPVEVKHKSNANASASSAESTSKTVEIYPVSHRHVPISRAR